MILIKFSILLVLAFQLAQCAKDKKPPHIIFIMADDLGWNDVSFHGSNQIPTPNIDALGYSGIILNNYYLQPICTPSRGALMTGLHPIHTGLQTWVILGNNPWGLPVEFKLLPEHLNDLGYESQIVGKWHLGYYEEKYFPTNRGFKEFTGFMNSHIDFYDYSVMYGPNDWGFDYWTGTEKDKSQFGRYVTDVLSEEGIKIIDNYNSTKPLFLYLSHLAVHMGSPLNSITAPARNIDKFPYIDYVKRRKFAGAVDRMDETVGEMLEALLRNDMLENSIIIFTSDNGGPAAGYGFNDASNWPLRGTKNSVWEGGMRGSGLIWSPLLKKMGRVSTQMMSILDWFPTLLSAAGADVESLGPIDGMDMWDTLSKNTPSPRKEILHNIDPIMRGESLRMGDWKIVNEPNSRGPVWDGWLGPSGRDEVDPKIGENIDEYFEIVLNSKSAKAIKSILPNAFENVKETRADAEILCGPAPADHSNCYEGPSRPCLFNIENDPCEYNDLADQYPHIVEEMLARLAEYNATAVPPLMQPVDPKADPIYWDASWTTYGDFPDQIMTED